MTNITKFAPLIIVLFLASCGGGGGGSAVPPVVGYVVDSPVEGLSYTCGALTGTTGSDGSFLHDAGAACTFKIGNVTIGAFNSAPTDGVITPHDLAGVSRGDSLNTSAVAIAQFLQSLDDGSGSGKIKIPSSVVSALSSVPAQKIVDGTTTLTQSALTNLVSTATGNSKTLVSAATAGAAMNSYIQTKYPDLDVNKGSAASSGSSSSSSSSTTFSAPSLTASPPKSLTAVLNTVGLTATTDVAAIGYYVVLPATASAPNKWQIVAGTDSSNNAASLFGSFNMTGGSAATQTITGLSFSTDYKVYFVAANASQTSKMTEVATSTVSIGAEPATPKLSTTATSYTTKTSLANISITSDQNGTLYWILVSSTAQSPSSSNIIDGKDATGAVVTKSGNSAISSGTASTIALSNLEYGTAYKYYAVATNVADAKKISSVTSADVVVNYPASPNIVVSGLASNLQLTLQNNAGNDLSITSNGTYTFADLASNAAAYSVTVSSQPFPQFCAIKNGTGTESRTNMIDVSVTCKDQYLYAVNSTRTGGVTIYKIGTNGSLTDTNQSVATGNTPADIIFDPTNSYAFVPNGMESSISQFKVNLDGSLSAMNPVTVSSDINPLFASTDIGGRKFFEISGTGAYTQSHPYININQYTIGSDGKLTALSTPAFDDRLNQAGQKELQGVFFEPTGKYSYALYGDVILQFSVGSDGSISALSTASVPIGSGILYGSGISGNLSGTAIYVTGAEKLMDNTSTIYQFGISSNGTLTPLSPATVANGNNFLGKILYSTDKKYAYVLTGNLIYQYSIDTNGKLTALNPASMVGGSFIVGGAIDNSGKYLYITYSGGSSIKSFSIGSDGKLTVGTTTTTATPSNPTSMFPAGIAIK